MQNTKKEMNLSKYYLVKFHESTGKVAKTMSALGSALLKLNSFKLMEKGYNIAVFSSVTGEVVLYIDENLKVDESIEYNMEDLCPGILEKLNQDPYLKLAGEE